MQQYEWKLNASGEPLYDYSEGELERRKAYLLNEVDLGTEASSTDIEELLNGRDKQIVCWGAGAGKTTALRQFITQHWRDGIVYAAKTTDEVDGFTYDVAAMIGKQYVFRLHNKIRHRHLRMYFADSSILEVYPVVATTHERLILDPPHTFTDFIRIDG